jgi:4-amino-4-deoxy-L-arabinose transferase-like glycosyltransferase
MHVKTSLTYPLIALAGVLLFLPFLGQVHLFDWDEINFAECAREMIVSGDYLRMQIDYMPFYEKPPLFIWMQVLSMKLFGVGEYAARLPDALTGIATLLTLFYAGKRVAGRQAGLWWVIMYAATWLPHFYFKSGIIDPVFNYFIFLGFFQAYLLKWGSRKILHAVLAGLFIGLAVLTKGPVAIVVSGISLVAYLILNRGLRGYRWQDFLVIALVAFGTTSLWFGVEIAKNGWTFFREFIAYQAGLFSQNIADHEEPWYYHPIVLLIGCFPASLFLFQHIRRSDRDEGSTRDFSRWMWILFWVVLILFSIVKTKIVHYSSLCYYPLTWIAAQRIVRLLEPGHRPRRGVLAGLLAIGSVWGLVLVALPLVGIYKAQLIPHIRDKFAAGNLQAAVPWHWSECLWGALYLAGIWASIWLMRRQFRKGIIALCLLQVLIIQVTILHFTPKIEAYSQRAAVEYFKSFAGKDVYVQVLGYKSYAHLFYSKKLPSRNPSYYRRSTSAVGASIVTEPNEAWLLAGPIDKPAYFISKLPDAPNWRKLPQLEEIGARNGFVFFRRRTP